MTTTTTAVDSPVVVEELFRLFKGVQLHGRRHPRVRADAERFVAIVAARLPVVIAFVGGGVFVDQSLVPLELEAWQRAMSVAGPLQTLGANELTFRLGLTSEDVVCLAFAWTEGALGNRDALDELGQLIGIGHRAIGSISRGADVEAVDNDIAVVAEAALAVADAERLVNGGEAPWTLQTAIVRRLERSAFSRPQPAVAAFEHARPTIARRAVSAALVAGALLRHVGASATVARTSAHAALLVGCVGLQTRSGTALDACREAAITLGMGEPLPRSGLEPHRLRVCSLLMADASDHPAAAVVALAYELERLRCPPELEFDLTNADIWAALALQAGITFPLPWVRVLVACFGAMPPGAWVMLADGRRGLVVSSTATGPIVLIDGVTLTNPGPLRLLSAAEVRP